MAINSDELKFYHPAVVDKTSSNGGVRSENVINFSVIGDAIAPATVAEASSGITKYHKLFLKLTNANDEALFTTKFGVSGQVAGDDKFFVAAGTESDVQSDAIAIASTDWAGGYDLNSAATAGDTTFDMVSESAAEGIDISRDFVITDGVNEEIVPISGVSWAGLVATITIDSSYRAGAGLAYSYATGANSKGASLIDLGTMVTSWNQVANPNSLTITGDITTHNSGTVTEEFIVDFLSSTTFRISRSSTPTLFFDKDTGLEDAASYTTFNISSAYTVQSPYLSTGNYLFEIPAGFFGGAIATGNTYTFNTKAAEKGVWVKRVIPAGSNGSSETIPFVTKGEGA